MGLRPTHRNEKRNRRAFIDSKQVKECFSTELPTIRQESVQNPANRLSNWFAGQG